MDGEEMDGGEMDGEEMDGEEMDGEKGTHVSLFSLFEQVLNFIRPRGLLDTPYGRLW